MYTISKWIGPEPDDCKTIKRVFSSLDDLREYIPLDKAYLYHISEWDGDPDKLGSSITDSFNGEILLTA